MSETIWQKKAKALIGCQPQDKRDDLWMTFNERAAICFYDGQLSLDDAEREAYNQVASEIKLSSVRVRQPGTG